MAYIGKKYKLESQEKFDEFLKVIPIPEEIKKAFLEYKPTTTLEKKGDEFILTSSRADGKDSINTFKSGVEFEEEYMEWKIKTTITVDGNKVTQVQKFDNGEVMTFIREFTETDLVLIFPI